MVKLQGRDDESYAFLPAYLEMVKISNPGSFSWIEWDAKTIENPQFRRMFISFKAMANGFKKGCRKLIGVDGTHLSGPFKGIMLTALGLDGDNGSFPLAYDIVDIENKINWKYFFQALVHVIDSRDGKDWTFISDKQKGLIKALDEVFPKAKRRICYVHLERNFKKNWPGPELKTLLYSAAYAYSEFEWRNYMEKIKIISKDVYAWLMREDVETWARHAFDHSTKFDDMTTNFVESFNGVIKDFRAKHVNQLLEEVRKNITEWFTEKRERAQEWSGVLWPSIKARLRNAEKEGRGCGLLYAGHGEFEIDDDGIGFIVNLNTKHCDCQEWGISGVPCRHAMRSILFMRANPEEYVDECFKVEKYKLAYKGIIHPMKDMKMWPKFVYPKLAPPPTKRGSGRPSIQRKRGSDEQRRKKRSSVVRCGQCHHLHHNKLGCTNQGNIQSTKKRVRINKKQPIEQPCQGVGSKRKSNSAGEKGQ